MLRLITLLVVAIAVGMIAPCSAIADEPDNAAKKDEASPEQTNLPMNQANVDPAAELLGRLNQEQLMGFAELIDQDWRDKPEWAEMALAVMRGQAMTPGMGWWKSTEKKYGWTWLKRKYDTNSDNVVERNEFPKESPASDLHFKRIDRSLDGKITSADFDVSIFQGETQTAGKARMAEFLLFRLDNDSNGQVTNEELSEFFKQADQEKSAFLTAEDILEALDDGESSRPAAESPLPPTTEQLKMFLSGQLGWFDEGPKLGDPAPEFKLATHDNSRTIGTADSKDKKPLVLIFGSFT